MVQSLLLFGGRLQCAKPTTTPWAKKRSRRPRAGVIKSTVALVQTGPSRAGIGGWASYPQRSDAISPQFGLLRNPLRSSPSVPPVIAFSAQERMMTGCHVLSIDDISLTNYLLHRCNFNRFIQASRYSSRSGFVPLTLPVGSA